MIRLPTILIRNSDSLAMILLAVVVASPATIRVAGTYIILNNPTTNQIGYRILKIVIAFFCVKSVIIFVIPIPPILQIC